MKFALNDKNEKTFNANNAKRNKFFSFINNSELHLNISVKLLLKKTLFVAHCSELFPFFNIGITDGLPKRGQCFLGNRHSRKNVNRKRKFCINTPSSTTDIRLKNNCEFLTYTPGHNLAKIQQFFLSFIHNLRKRGSILRKAVTRTFARTISAHSLPRQKSIIFS